MKITKASMNDLDQITALEEACFPKEKAADREIFQNRLNVFPDRFWLLRDEEGRIISFVNGMCTDSEDLSDAMYAEAGMHNPAGEWQMIFGVDTDPAYRNCGYAYTVLNACLDECRLEGRTGAVLTCVKNMIPFYERLGFVSEGLSPSVHGNAAWYQMRILFKKYLL